MACTTYYVISRKVVIKRWDKFKIELPKEYRVRGEGEVGNSPAHELILEYTRVFSSCMLEVKSMSENDK